MMMLNVEWETVDGEYCRGVFWRWELAEVIADIIAEHGRIISVMEY